MKWYIVTDVHLLCLNVGSWDGPFEYTDNRGMVHPGIAMLSEKVEFFVS